VGLREELAMEDGFRASLRGLLVALVGLLIVIGILGVGTLLFYGTGAARVSAGAETSPARNP
jgi:hypothetical protein